MPTAIAKKRARKAAQEGKSPSTQAGEFVREEIEEIREGKHGARSPKQAIAIGLSQARRAGVKLPPYKGANKGANKGAKTKSNPSMNSKRAQNHPSPRRSTATLQALKREPRSSVSHEALAKQAHEVAKRRGPAKRHEAAMKAVRTKGHTGLARAAKKAAHTRETRAH